jgi:hypothetical protein
LIAAVRNRSVMNGDTVSQLFSTLAESAFASAQAA